MAGITKSLVDLATLKKELLPKIITKKTWCHVKDIY